VLTVPSLRQSSPPFPLQTTTTTLSPPSLQIACSLCSSAPEDSQEGSSSFFTLWSPASAPGRHCKVSTTERPGSTLDLILAERMKESEQLWEKRQSRKASGRNDDLVKTKRRIEAVRERERSRRFLFQQRKALQQGAAVKQGGCARREGREVRSQARTAGVERKYE
jgi:hypothetical protein